jgi:predicted nuclease of predicted toxin-antitoxin system
VRLLADEGIDAAIVAHLRAHGHDVVYVAELSPGITDDAVLELSRTDQRVLMTSDKDFGELVFRLRRALVGVLLVRLAGLPSQSKAADVARVVDEHGDEMAGAFTVLSPGLVRIRRPL